MENIFYLIGAIFLFISGIGLIKMPDFLSRMQAVSKASTVGVFFMMLGGIAANPNMEVMIKSLVVAMILLLTAPLGTHALAFAFHQKPNTNLESK